MTNSIYPCIWFDGNAGEAMQLYCSVFRDSKIVVDTAMVVNAQLCGQLFMGLNGGPAFKPNASISFMVICDTPEEADGYREKLLPGGFELMPMGDYAWSPRYCWLQDKFGVNWQLYTGNIAQVGQKIVPTLMFCQAQQGRAEEAIAFYKQLIQPSSSAGILKYTEGSTKGQVQHAQFSVKDYVLMAMDSGVPQTITFTEAVSLVIMCDTQAEIDYYWNGFTEKGAESRCGWCKDEFGVSWQIVPSILPVLMKDPVRANRVMQAVMKMNKLNIAAMENA